MIYKYETHCHTSPVSYCGRATVQDTVRFYQAIGYDGIFLTNHRKKKDLRDDKIPQIFCIRISVYPLTAPLVMPAMICSWKSTYPRMDGIIDITMAAYIET